MYLFEKNETYEFSVLKFSKSDKTHMNRLIETDRDCDRLGYTCVFQDYCYLNIEQDLHILDHIFVEKESRGQGIATKTIRNYINKYPGDLIVGFIGVRYKECPNRDEMSDEDYAIIVNNLLKFCYKLGFVALHPYFQSEQSVAVVMPNPIGLSYNKFLQDRYELWDYKSF